MPRKYGTGSLSQRRGKHGDLTWYGAWRIGDRKVARALGPVRMPGGRTGLSEKAAEVELRRLMATVTVESTVQKIDFEYAGRLYRKHLERQGRKKATLTAVESCLRVWVIPAWPTKTLADVSYHDVEDLIDRMEKKNLTPKSIHNYIGTLSALYSYALHPKREWARSNPCAAVDLPAIPENEEIRFLTVEEIDAVVRSVPWGDYQALDRVMIRVAAMTGLREGELIALRWMDVDWPASRIRVRRNHVLGEFVTPKSKTSTRSVPLATSAAQALAAFQPLDADDEALVFPDPVTGEPLAKRRILLRFRAALKAAGLDESHRFHDLRHTFGTRVAASGAPIRTLQEWMGHRDIQTTMRYAAYAPSARETEMVDAAFAAEPLPENDREEAL